MTNVLKKDYNKPSPYNGGVLLCRIALCLLAAALCALLWRLSYSPPALKGEGVQEITVTEKSARSSVTYTRRARQRRRYTVKAVNAETGHEYTQSVTEDEYNRLAEGEKYYKNVFETKDGYFISWDNISEEKEAARVYYRRFPNAEIVSRNIVVVLCFGLFALNTVLGAVLIVSAERKQRSAAVVKQSLSYEDMFKSDKSK